MPTPRKTAADTMNTSRRVKREQQAEADAAVVAATLAADDTYQPKDADPRWHPIAKQVWSSLGESHQRAFYEPSDWATAWLVCETISREFGLKVVGFNPVTGQPVMAEVAPTGASLAAILKGLSGLLVTQGDRLRAGLELPSRASQLGASTPDDMLAQRRKALGG
jgi:hypothetical protein